MKYKYKSITVHVHPSYHKVYKYLSQKDKKELKQKMKELLLTVLDAKKASVKYPQYTCPVCLMRFKYDYLMHVHVKSHDEYVCFVCGKTFPHDYNGKVDLLLHFNKMHTKREEFEITES